MPLFMKLAMLLKEVLELAETVPCVIALVLLSHRRPLLQVVTPCKCNLQLRMTKDEVQVQGTGPGGPVLPKRNVYQQKAKRNKRISTRVWLRSFSSKWSSITEIYSYSISIALSLIGSTNSPRSTTKDPGACKQSKKCRLQAFAERHRTPGGSMLMYVPGIDCRWVGCFWSGFDHQFGTSPQRCWQDLRSVVSSKLKPLIFSINDISMTIVWCHMYQGWMTRSSRELISTPWSMSFKHPKAVWRNREQCCKESIIVNLQSVPACRTSPRRSKMPTWLFQPMTVVWI